MQEVFLITVSGEDRPGLTAALSNVLARYDITVLDSGQSVIHNSLSRGL